METYDLLQVAGREWRTLCHSSDFAAKEKSLLGGTGSCGGIITAPYGGSQRSRKHSNCAVRGQQESTGKSQTQRGGVHFPKTLWVSVLKIGADGGARSSLKWSATPLRPGRAPFCEHSLIMGTHDRHAADLADLTAEDV